MQESEVRLDRLSLLFDDKAKLKCNFVVEHVPNGKYQIKVRSISADMGSVSDEWRRLNMNVFLSKQEIEYLKSICTPQISIYTLDVANGTLVIETFLDPQEIQSIHIIRQ